MSKIVVAATQMSCTWNRKGNLDKAEQMVRRAANAGANVVLLQELFETPYFCADEDPEYFQFAHATTDSSLISRFAALARELNVVLPVSFFESHNNAFFNSVVVIDADGRQAGHYRKSHIPQGPGYREKYYFSPGDTGFSPVDTAAGRLGVAICWDQWFPETARILVLKGAEVLFFPTAIGSEPQNPAYDSSGHWRRTMQGHAAANMAPLVASNRTGAENNASCRLTFYGQSFIADQFGAVVTEADRESEGFILAALDVDEIRQQRAAWGLFRDRRPDLYAEIASLDGRTGCPPSWRSGLDQGDWP